MKTNRRNNYNLLWLWTGILQHLHEERINFSLAHQIKEKQMFQAFQRDGSESRKPQEQLRKSGKFMSVSGSCVLLQRRIDLIT